MGFSCFKSLLVIAFGAFSLLLSVPVFSQHEDGHKHSEKQDPNHEKKQKEGFNASEVIFGHVLNAHEFHFLDIGGSPRHNSPPGNTIFTTKRVYEFYVFQV